MFACEIKTFQGNVLKGILIVILSGRINHEM